ncbi:hypothetical protein Emtol_1440 [Emticicia oligotrophica DSM 17448]|uniref:Outer membrane protein beta-barrel domain-containing protein n=1 Tax=Emticicia oligotrophica (strain DSM 17448 / CIP 109782 / MTCC 6937 / GPTSA100-15) TaxID=929562 RepID=A0ABM5MZG7_EMTOG|nr:hypothetical protein [Emticicia oligotrophica]AFK02586.1 hypothetical protein Emtol_1440 [Emticicia oligotrophica DSM 17448]
MRKIILASALIICSLSIFAQEPVPTAPTTTGGRETQNQIFFEKPQPAWKDKLRYGGNFWLGFFGAFYIDASPMVGYEVTEKGTIVGVGGTFIFQGTFNRNSAANTNNTIFGPKIFVRQQVFKRVFVHGEYEFIRAYADQFYSYNLNSGDPNRKVWGRSPLIGAGFYQGGQGNRGSFISVMYNLGYPNQGFISPQSLLGSQTPITLRYGFLF